MRRLLIDTDTASDDAVALVLALRHPGVQVEAITVVAGNVPLEQAVQNALFTVELCGSRVPVHSGATGPLTRPLETAQFVHGEDGMADIGLPLAGRRPHPAEAVDVISSTINQHPGEITLVTLGPLTNVATALIREPSLASKVIECVIMGGTGHGPGNVTDNAEYNIWVDPEAATVVFESGMPIKLVGWDISCKYATFGPGAARELRDIGTDLARFCIDIQATVDRYAVEVSGLEGFDLPDPIAMAIALDSRIATRTRKVNVSVGTGENDRGATPIDPSRPPNVEMVEEADRELFLEMLRRALGPA
ncbi:MAG TPA: nucleoside hydrolase [Acidimicrobiia bacterium]|nr:nucleoside hydrolase [Acidimicrobiia bacterium]